MYPCWRYVWKIFVISRNSRLRKFNDNICRKTWRLCVVPSGWWYNICPTIPMDPFTIFHSIMKILRRITDTPTHNIVILGYDMSLIQWLHQFFIIMSYEEVISHVGVLWFFIRKLNTIFCVCSQVGIKWIVLLNILCSSSKK